MVQLDHAITDVKGSTNIINDRGISVIANVEIFKKCLEGSKVIYPL